MQQWSCESKLEKLSSCYPITAQLLEKSCWCWATLPLQNHCNFV